MDRVDKHTKKYKPTNKSSSEQNIPLLISLVILSQYKIFQSIVMEIGNYFIRKTHINKQMTTHHIHN